MHLVSYSLMCPYCYCLLAISEFGTQFGTHMQACAHTHTHTHTYTVRQFINTD